MLKFYGEEVRKQRKRMKISQVQLGNILGVSASIISFKENGDRDFNVYELHELYVKVGIDVGFSKNFDLIDSGEIEYYINKAITEKKLIGISNIFGLSQIDIKLIKEKNYNMMSFETLYRMEGILGYIENSRVVFRPRYIVCAEKDRKELTDIINKHIQLYGLKRTINLLKADIDLNIYDFLKTFSKKY